MKNRSLVNLDINPCRTCMPLGAVTAFKGIEGAMVLLHGSQGCSTYIRRHMAAHYNEPVDIASSSLNENGTVFGGEDNLKKGLTNIRKQYSPKVIGVFTTCLAETIGEDIERFVHEYKADNIADLDEDIDYVTVKTPGYGGSQFEGYYSALKSIVMNLADNGVKNNKLNIIMPDFNPGDYREIKRILKLFNADYIMLPDISNTLDSSYSKSYKKIPDGGTKKADMHLMAGAIATIEIGKTVTDELSPGYYLKEKYQVPLFRCSIPTGLRNTDELINLIATILKKPVPDEITEERGKLLDAMIDSHKHNGEGRAVIFGQPEIVCGITSLCFENGIKPLLVASGTKNESLQNLLKDDIDASGEEVLIITDTDFETIEKYTNNLDANILIGNSDGRRMEIKLNIPLLRIGFPVHDRIGAQRINNSGYVGTLRLLDNITNIILERKERGYRSSIYEKYFKSKDKVEKVVLEAPKSPVTNSQKTETHPCYNQCAHDYARLHIPVAPKCNVSCNYCNRKYDCPNESRPGVTCSILSPEEALLRFIEVKKKMPNLKVVGIAGPGDALANFEETRKSIKLIKEEDPDITFCLSTNGLMLPFYAEELINLGVSHVTITINTLKKEIAAKIYKEVNYLGEKLTGERAGEVLIHNQISGLKYLTSRGIVCKVNIVMLKGINEDDIQETVKKVKECGAFMTNIMQMIPVQGSAFENMPLTSNVEIKAMREKCSIDLKQMMHCRQCRADAVGTLAEDRSIELWKNKELKSRVPEGKLENKEIIEGKPLLFGVTSRSGINIDQHFGHAKEIYIYSYNAGEISFVEKRIIDKYCTGKEECYETEDKIGTLINTLQDCYGVMTMRIGAEPLKKLQEKGIKVFQMYEEIKEGINLAAKNENKDNVEVKL